MSGQVLKCYVLVLLSLSLTLNVDGISARELHLLPSEGSGKECFGGESCFHALQDALDGSVPGDVILVHPGAHRVKSRIVFPPWPVVVKGAGSSGGEAVLEAGCPGLVFVFGHDQGPDTQIRDLVFKITCRAAPTVYKFELSPNANPTTSGIKLLIEADGGASKAAPRTGWEITDTERVWNGYDPFSQPFPTTGYWGSGDVDGDGDVDQQDVDALSEILASTRPETFRADVDGDGQVTSTDLSLLEQAVQNGDVLPGWWDRLATRSQREHWVDRVMALDNGDRHPYQFGWWVCHHFANQLHFRCAGYRCDLHHTDYDGGEPVFNIPMYKVTIIQDVAFHAINAILVGDDPLNFDDWQFREPQTDGIVQPGQWNMPYNSTVVILTSANGGEQPRPLIRFYVDENGWELLNYDENLVLQRPPARNVFRGPFGDMWDPFPITLSGGANALLVTAKSEGMHPVLDIFMAEEIRKGPCELDPVSPLVEADKYLLPVLSRCCWDKDPACPLVGADKYSRVLATAADDQGRTWLLWKGQDDWDSGEYVSRLQEPQQGGCPELADTARVGSEKFPLGTAAVWAGSKLIACWRWYDRDADLDKISCNIFDGSSWSGEEEVAEAFGWSWHAHDVDRRVNPGRNSIALAAGPGGTAMLVWSDRILVKCRIWDGNSWSSSSYTVGGGRTEGVAVTYSDQLGWVALLQHSNFEDPDGGFGDICATRSLDGQNWEEEECFEGVLEGASPVLATLDDGSVVGAWQELEGDVPHLAWSFLDPSGAWSQVARYWPELRDAGCWYPALRVPVSLRRGDQVAQLAWSERSPAKVTVDSYGLRRGTGTLQVMLVPEEAVQQGGSWRVDFSDQWHQGPGSETGLAAGMHRVELSDLAGWYPHPPLHVEVLPDDTAWVVCCYREEASGCGSAASAAAVAEAILLHFDACSGYCPLWDSGSDGFIDPEDVVGVASSIFGAKVQR